MIYPYNYYYLYSVEFPAKYVTFLGFRLWKKKPVIYHAYSQSAEKLKAEYPKAKISLVASVETYGDINFFNKGERQCNTELTS